MMRKKTNLVKEEIDPRYMSALREFVGETNRNPEFFKLSTDEQRIIAFDTIQKHKKVVGYQEY